MTIRIHGREYHTVAERVHDFRQAHPAKDGWGITAECVERGEHIVCFRAAIVDPDGRVVAEGWAEEDRRSGKINRSAAVENCETSAIGRALAAAGYGGGGEYASADEVLRARAGKDTLSAAERLHEEQRHKVGELLRSVGRGSKAEANELIQQISDGTLSLADVKTQPGAVLAVLHEWRELQAGEAT